jgi:hypothetical protein
LRVADQNLDHGVRCLAPAGDRLGDQRRVARAVAVIDRIGAAMRALKLSCFPASGSI